MTGDSTDAPAKGRDRWRAVHGVLLVDKPSGITSTAALARARRALRAAKGGHTGTLDPLASGLLPLCFGEATKFASDLLDADKAYVATARLGVTTDTGDAEGAVLETRDVDVDRDAIERAFARFRGPIEQIPPMHSALKRDGRALYEYAREGKVVERAARAVVIHALELRALDGPVLTFAVECSKGTYIRTLAEDIGHVLGCGAHLTALRRTHAGRLDVADAVPLATFESMVESERAALLLPVDALLESLPRVDLDVSSTRRFLDGQRLAWPDADHQGRVRVYGRSEVDEPGHAALLGTALLGFDDRLAPLRVVAQTAKA